MSVLDLAKAHSDACLTAATEAKRPVVGTGNFKKKVVSDSAAVHPDQIPEVIEHCKKAGVAVPEFASHGRPIFDNSVHFRRYLRSLNKRHYQY